MQQVNARLRDVQDKIRDNVDAYAGRGQAIERLQQEYAVIASCLMTTNCLFDRITRLKDKSHQRINQLRSWDRDCADVIGWLREHRHLFRQEVFEPAIVSLSIPDQRYADAIEACFNANQLKVYIELQKRVEYLLRQL